MHLFLIRHGQSETNLRWDNIVSNAQMNSHLTDQGRQEAQQAADWLGSQIGRIDALYTSSLNRAVQTAKYFEDRFGLTAVTDHRIREGGYSYDDARPVEDDLLPIRKVVKLRTEPYTRFAEQPAGIESYNDLRTRAGSFLTDLTRDHLGQRVVVITHGWTINAFMDVIYNAALSRSVYLHLHNTAITYVEYIRHDQSSRSVEWEPWRLYFVGATPHLDVFPGGLDPQEPED
jgi:probable phosphoglycerate mutase